MYHLLASYKSRNSFSRIVGYRPTTCVRVDHRSDAAAAAAAATTCPSISWHFAVARSKTLDYVTVSGYWTTLTALTCARIF